MAWVQCQLKDGLVYHPKQYVAPQEDFFFFTSVSP